MWRLCRRAHTAFDGEGARLYGGRWNRPGTRLVYTSGDAALAVIEFFVHLEPVDAPDDLVLITADIPDSVAIEEGPQLRGNWRVYPAPERLARIGNDWATRNAAAVLSVRSAIIPVARNYLLNPRHPDFSAIAIGRPQPFTLDPRFWKKRTK